MKSIIYADHAATTPLSAAAWDAMQPYINGEFGNPSTLYRLAAKPRRAIAEAREKIAQAIGAQPEEIIFTSGGTEADNMAIKGTAFRYPGERRHFITTAIEHHAVLNTFDFLRRMGHDIDVLSVDRRGLVSPEELVDHIGQHTVLVSVMLSNNEIGAIEPIQLLTEAAHDRGVLFHTDAVQAVGHIPVDVNALGVDMLSASAHKFNGPKGTGFLYLRRGTPIEPLISGGGQEHGMRAGTENVAGIVGMAVALMEHVRTMSADAEKLEGLRTLLLDGLTKAGIDFIVNGSNAHVPGSLSLSFRDVSGEMLLHRLDLMGICVATGSACNSKEMRLSHVLQAIQVDPAYAHGTIRITLGNDNDAEQVKAIVKSIVNIIILSKGMMG